MASFRDIYTREVEGLFGNLHRGPFTDDSPNAVPQETGGQIQPVGWVKNSDGSGGAQVEIDSRGITVTDGAISVIADDGATVLIDGSSEIFLLAATGTKAVNVTSAVLIHAEYAIVSTNLGASYLPAYLCYLTNSAGMAETPTVAYDYGIAKVVQTTATNISAPSPTQTQVDFYVFQNSGSIGTYTFRYFLFSRRAF